MILRPPRSTLFPYTRSSDLSSSSTMAIGELDAVGVVTSSGSSPLGGTHPSSSSGVGDGIATTVPRWPGRSEEHTSELQSQSNLVCRLLLEKKKIYSTIKSLI